MGNIRIYDAQVGGTATVQSRADAEDFGAGIGRGLQAVGRGMQRQADKMEQDRERQEVSDAASRGYQDDLALEKEYHAYVQTAVPGDREAASRWESRVRQYFTDNPDRPQYTSPRARDYQNQLAERSINQFAVRGLALQANLNGQKFKDDILTAGEAFNQQSAANPDSYVANRDRIRAEAEAGLGAFEFAVPGQRALVVENLTESAAWNAGLGRLAQSGGTEWLLGQVAPAALQGKDWRGSLNLKPTGKAGLEWWDDLDTEKKIQLVTKADADFQQSRRLAAGNLKDLLDGQIAELKLYGTVKHPLSRAQFAILGEDAEKEWTAYQGNRRAYGLAFEYIKLDPAEAQRRMEALKPPPGNVTPDSLQQYQLVVGAYSTLQEQLRKDPVGTAQAREMPGVRKDIDWNNDTAVLTELNQRAPAVRDLARNNGRVTWLSAAEAEALRRRTSGMGDRELRQFFLDVRSAIPDAREFKAFATQLFPDNPAVRNGTTLLHKTNTQVTVDGVTYDATQVSSRILKGSRYLDNDTPEGKGLRASGLPDNDKLLKVFRAEVGDAVPPEYMTDAYQTALAFYIGDGLANNRMGLSSGQVDSKMMRRAVDLTLGQRHTNPDGSRLFLPWGMDDGRFRNEAKARYDALRVRNKWTGDFSAQTLVPVPGQEGIYGIKAGVGVIGFIDLNKPVDAQ